AAALKAWGSRQNLFREGVASETKDPQAVAAALAKPGVVLRRPVGSNAPFSENPGLPQIPKLPKKPLPAKTQTKSQPPEHPPRREPPRLRLVPPPPAPRPQPALRPQVSRAPIEAAERALAELKGDEQRARAALEERKAALDEEARRQRADFRERRERCEKKLADARKAYRSALARR
ncbi:MAG TPA: hypothetical protein VEU95_10830, partial [Micropepsaceae bacterium]|nr:hypothetical protein [Micropepsaceae bacterium]